jgi:hypothetical protein
MKLDEGCPSFERTLYGAVLLGGVVEERKELQDAGCFFRGWWQRCGVERGLHLRNAPLSMDMVERLAIEFVAKVSERTLIQRDAKVPAL